MNIITDPVGKAFLFHGTIVLGKTLSMSMLTIMAHMKKKKVFISKEDTNTSGGVKKFDPDVERIRRCHLNDLENVYAFVMLGAMYCATRPEYSTALWHFRIFTVARVLHTLVYVNKVPQPARGLAFAAGAGVCASMAYHILKTVW